MKQALRLLKRGGGKVVGISSLYRTQPVEVPDQPWFLNAAVEIEIRKTPREVLRLVKSIEFRMGRKQSQSKGPRVIDIDIILAGECIIMTKHLIIPHPKMYQRNFVLIPLQEICPNAIHPLLNKSITTLAAESTDRASVKRLKPWRED